MKKLMQMAVLAIALVATASCSVKELRGECPEKYAPRGYWMSVYNKPLDGTLWGQAAGFSQLFIGPEGSTLVKYIVYTYFYNDSTAVMFYGDDFSRKESSDIEIIGDMHKFTFVRDADLFEDGIVRMPHVKNVTAGHQYDSLNVKFCDIGTLEGNANSNYRIDLEGYSDYFISLQLINEEFDMTTMHVDWTPGTKANGPFAWTQNE